LALSPNGRTLAVGSGSPTFTAGRPIQRWNVNDLTHPAALGSPLNDDGGAVAAVAFSPDGRVLSARPSDGVGFVTSFDVKTHFRLRTPR
jgi:WD40 repeat protein